MDKRLIGFVSLTIIIFVGLCCISTIGIFAALKYTEYGKEESLGICYIKKGNDIYYQYDTETSLGIFDIFLNGPIVRNKLESVDLESFVPYERSTITNIQEARGLLHGRAYAVDKNHVYYGWEIIPGADPSSFELVGVEGLARDKYATYDRGEKIDKK